MSKYKTDEYRKWHAQNAREWRRRNKERNYATQVRYKVKNPDKYRETQMNAGLLKNYGITKKQRDDMFAAQGYKCAICPSVTSNRKNQAWAVDHCHATGKVRGVLCHHCNAVLGYARDDCAILQAAIAYLGRIEGAM